MQVSQNGGVMQNSGTQRPHLIGAPSVTGPIVDRLNGGYFNQDAFTRPASATNFTNNSRNVQLGFKYYF